MNTIKLNKLLPSVFSTRSDISSEVWLSEMEFNRGEKYLVEARSGDGKSSLCSYLYGYRNDYSGELVFDDKNVASYGASDWKTVRRESISMLFQDLRLFGELSAMDNVLLKNSLTKYKTKKQIKALFAAFSIEDKLRVPASRLSFGQQQRVAFIRALCQPFDMIVLDEPVSHLDEVNGRILGNILTQELTERGAGAIVTSVGNDLDIQYSKKIRL